MKKAANNMVKIAGIVIPFDWDERGKVVAVAVSTFDEEVYLVDNREKGAEMLDLLREQVEIRGEVRNEDYKKVITVKKYTLKPVNHGVSIH